MYDAYLFDWDGTLADTLPFWLKFYKDVFHHFGLELSEREMGQKVIGNFNFDKDFGLNDREYINKKFAEVYPMLAKGVEFNPGAIEMLTELHRRGAKLAIVTSTDRMGIEHSLNRTRLITLFSAIITAEDTNNHKPDPEPLQVAIAQLGVDPEKTVMVGDTYNDIFPAKKLDIKSILYHHPGVHDKYYDLADLVKQYPPDHVVANLEDILSL